MARFGISINETFVHSQKANRPDRFGRRVRYVNGVDYDAEDDRGAFNPLFLKFALSLAVIAVLASASALWRLFHFPH